MKVAPESSLIKTSTKRQPIAGSARLSVPRRWRIWIGVCTLVMLGVAAGPWLIWSYHMDSARRLLENGLIWPTPRLVESLPTERDAATLDLARAHIERARSWLPQHPYSYRLLARIDTARQNWSAASDHIEEARRLAPRDPVIAWDAAKIAWQQIQHATNQDASAMADEQMRRSLRAAGVDAAMLFAWGQEAWNDRNVDITLARYAWSEYLQPNQPRIWYARGLVYAAQQRPDLARDAFREMIRLDPTNRDGWFQLGRVELGEKDLAAALPAFEQARKANTGTTGVSAVYFYIGYVKQWLRTPTGIDLEGAVDAYRAALRHDDFGANTQFEAFTHMYLATILLEWQQPAQAVLELEAAIRRDPTLPHPRVVLARAQWQLGQTDEAITTVRQAIDIDPKHVDGYRLLGEIYAAEGRAAEAREMFRRVLSIAPDDAAAKAALEQLDATPPSP